MTKLNAKRKAASLFEDEGEDDQLDEKPAITINTEYAKRFEHNKRRTELHRLQAKHPELAARIEAREMRKAARAGANEEDEDDESESSEDEDDGIIPASKEKEWVEALVKIKSKDPAIYDANTRLFTEQPSEDEEGSDDGAESEDGEDESGASKSGKKKTLRDILYAQAVVEERPSDLDADTDLERRARLRDDRRKSLVYDEEQRKLKSDLLSKLNAADDTNDEDDGLTKKRTLPVDTEDSNTVEVQQMLDQYFGQQSKSKDDAFLQAYLKKRLWAADEDDEALQKHALGHESDEEALDADAEDDEEFLDTADDFERHYNFRSEEPGGHTIQTFPRKVVATVRKEESKRKRQRESKQARAEAAKAQREEELKQLKNLKKKEVRDAMSQLQSIAGKAAPDAAMLDALLNADFDPDAWDKHMAEAFNDDYYNEKEQEDEILADEQAVQMAAAEWADDDGDGSGDGDDGTFAAIHKRVTGKAPSALPENDYDVAEPSPDEDDEGEVEPERLAESRDKIQKLLQEYYKLDYEDDIGGLKTRFKYRQVEPIKDTLDAAEILAMTDKELNAIVGLKRLAPYRDDAGKIRPNYVALSEARKRLRTLGFKSRRPKSDTAPGKGKSGGKPAEHKHGDRKEKMREKEKQGTGVKEERVEHGGQEGRGKKRKHRGPDAEDGGPAGPKKKRPGPALRRALKAAQQAGASGDPADAGRDKTPLPKQPKPSGGDSRSDVTTKQKPQTPAAKDSAKTPVHKVKTPVSDAAADGDTSKEAKMQRRLASFAKLALPHAREKPQATGGHKKSAASEGAEATPTPASAVPGIENMPKSQKKNVKRALKRRASAPSSES